MPASTPLPETSTSATSSVLPSSERVATRKSPEKDAPPAERSTTSACQPSGRAGISPWAVSRSRRSTSIESPRVPCTPSRPRERASRCTIPAVATTTSTAPGDTRGAVPRAISSTTTEATTTSSRTRLRTESRKPPARTTTARADSGNQVRFTRNRAPSAAAHRLRATSVNPSECSTCRRTQVRARHQTAPRPRRLGRVADMTTTVASVTLRHRKTGKDLGGPAAIGALVGTSHEHRPPGLADPHPRRRRLAGLHRAGLARVRQLGPGRAARDRAGSPGAGPQHRGHRGRRPGRHRHGLQLRPHRARRRRAGRRHQLGRGPADAPAPRRAQRADGPPARRAARRRPGADRGAVGLRAADLRAVRLRARLAVLVADGRSQRHARWTRPRPPTPT